MILEEKEIYCYNCRKNSLFTRKDLKNSSGVESHCSECSTIWFEWQNRALDREKEKWLEYNGELANKTTSTSSTFLHNEKDKNIFTQF
jgi:hypothetical protein